MNLSHLIYFEKVAELEHYTRAAEELHITQPCLSHAIGELEKELGIPLFYKVGRNIRLTRYGADFLKHVKVALKEINDGVEEIRINTGTQEGRIFLGHISSMNDWYLPYLMTNFYREPANTHVKLEMHEAPTREIVKELKERKLDVGLGGYIDDPELQFDRIYRERLAVIASCAHPLAERQSARLEELAEYDFVAYDPVCSIREDTDQLFRQVGVERKIVGEYQDNHMIVGMVSHGMGIAVVPERYAREWSNVKKISIESDQAERGLYMITLKNEYRSPLIDRFMNYVKNLSEKENDAVH